ncbi:MAG: hypothetical protein HY335_01595 [Deinococcus sp.]|nr:hypothetical protein [Deinococcus sp.]
MFIEVGNFTNTGDVPINPHRHLCTNNVHLLGIGGEDARAYGPALRQLSRDAGRFPLDKFVSHRFALEEAEKAMQVAMSPDSLKVAFEPARAKA